MKLSLPLLLILIALFFVACGSNAGEYIEPTTSTAETAINNGSPAIVTVGKPGPTEPPLTATSDPTPTSEPTEEPTAVPTETPASKVIINPEIELPNAVDTGDGRLVVNYPDTWYATGLRQPGETVNNVAISNNSGGFTGDSGQILVQIFEPVYVMELFGILDTSTVTLEDIYTAIISGNEQNFPENGGEPQYLSLDGRELLRLDFTVPQYDTLMLSKRTSDGYIVQMNAVMAPGELDQFEDVVMAIAATLDYIAPDRDIPEGSPADVIQRHFQMIASGNFQDTEELYCQQDLIMFGIFEDLVGEATDIEISDETFETITGFARAMAVPDFSNLFYQTVLLEQEEQAIVRVSGNVIITNSEGERQLVPYLKFTPADSDGWRLIWENNQWKICVLF